MDITRLLLVVLAAVIGGGMNAIAGGGTLVTFPAIVGLGIPAIVANATSTVALWPGQIASIYGYRAELTGARAWAIRFAIPSLIGGIVGAHLLLRTPSERFDVVVPWLVLGATTLFLLQRPIMAALGKKPSLDDPVTRLPSAGLLLFQFGVGVYGGYFGAGIGILMLAALGLMGFTNIHQMNGLKNWGGLCMNAVAAGIFVFSDLVNWPVAIAMAIGATVGGYGGSRLAQRVSKDAVRGTIVFIGLVASAWLFFR